MGSYYFYPLFLCLLNWKAYKTLIPARSRSDKIVKIYSALKSNGPSGQSLCNLVSVALSNREYFYPSVYRVLVHCTIKLPVPIYTPG